MKWLPSRYLPAQVNNRNTRTTGMFKVNNKDVTGIVLLFILLTQNILEPLF